MEQTFSDGILSGDCSAWYENAKLRSTTSYTLVKDKKGLLEKLNSHKKEIRKALGDRIRNQARIIPELVFQIDETEENAVRMDELIKNLNIPPDK